MRPPVGPDIKPPFDYLITKTVYTGTMREQSTTFTATFNVHVLKRSAFVKVAILPESVALADMRIEGEPGLVVRENGYHNVVLPNAGEYTVTALYSVKSSLEKGPHKIDLPIRQAPITLLSLEMPMRNIEVEIPQAQQVLTTQQGDMTTVSAVISSATMDSAGVVGWPGGRAVVGCPSGIAGVADRFSSAPEK